MFEYSFMTIFTMTASRRTAAALAGVAVFVAIALAQNPFQKAADAVKDEKVAKSPAELQFDMEARTHAPGPIPDRAILTWNADPSTTQSVTWRTDTSVTNPVAEIALSEGEARFDASGKATHVKGRTEALKTALNDAHYHSVTFTGLQPKTKYLYRVGDGKQWSEWFQFETASATAEPFGFIYFGDAQNDIKSKWSRVARGAFSDMPRAKFIIHAGDLINNRDDDAQWGEWHTAAGWINGMVPSLPTPGNHEYRPLDLHWRAQFTLPENGPPGLEETCYFLDYQGVRFISLNTEEKIAEQAAWLDRVLTSRPGSIRWVVVTLHRPIYSTLRGRNNPEVHDNWRPVFDRHGVDLVLQGHDHSYGRSGLMRDDNILTGAQVQNEHGTVYVVSVSGPKMYTVGEESWMAQRGEGFQLYQLIRIDGDALKYESRTARGDLFDAFELRKQANGVNLLFEGEAPLLKKRSPESSRQLWNAVGVLLILVTVGLGVSWAVRSRKRRFV